MPFARRRHGYLQNGRHLNKFAFDGQLPCAADTASFSLYEDISRFMKARTLGVATTHLVTSTCSYGLLHRKKINGWRISDSRDPRDKTSLLDFKKLTLQYPLTPLNIRDIWRWQNILKLYILKSHPAEYCKELFSFRLYCIQWEYREFEYSAMRMWWQCVMLMLWSFL